MRIYTTILAILLCLGLQAQSYDELCESGAAALGKGEYDKAAKQFGKALLESRSDKEKIYALLNLAYSQQMGGKLKYALESYDKAAAMSGNNTQVLLLRGRLFMEIDSTAKAAEDFSEVIRREPGNCDALFARAHAYTDGGEYEKPWRITEH